MLPAQHFLQMIQLSVAIPKKLTEKQAELLREYAETEKVDVNAESKTFFDKIKKHFNNK